MCFWWREPAAGALPLDQHDFMVADMAAAIRLPVIVVTDASLGAINRTLLTVQAIRQRNLAVMGLVINRVPGVKNRDYSEETNLEELPRLSGVPVRGILPDSGTDSIGDNVPQAFIDAMMPFTREWLAMQQTNA